MEVRSRPVRALAVSVKAVSDWMPSEALERPLPLPLGRGFMRTGLLSMGEFSGERGRVGTGLLNLLGVLT